MRTLWTMLATLYLFLLAAEGRTEDVSPADLLKQAKRVVFLGDSITAGGQYVAFFDAWVVAQRWETAPKLINCGLPSETVSGLSEAGHAGGKFPRPDLEERLDRILALTRPDLVIACYGINCGIYQPFDDGRFKSYQQGIERLKSKVENAHAKLVIVTPPFYDDQRSSRPFSYNGVLDRYSEWLVKQREKGWLVVDLHGPMTEEMERHRKRDPQFTFQPDGVHPNDAGHWFIAQQLIRAFGDRVAGDAESPEMLWEQRKLPAEVPPLVKQRMSVLRDAYVSAAGHKRPGVAKGLPIPDAEKQAADLSARIAETLARAE